MKTQKGYILPIILILILLILAGVVMFIPKEAQMPTKEDIIPTATTTIPDTTPANSLEEEDLIIEDISTATSTSTQYATSSDIQLENE